MLLLAATLACGQSVQVGGFGTCFGGAPNCGPSVTSLSILPASPTMVNGQSLQMNAAGNESDGTSGGLLTPACDGNWSVSNGTVISVSTTGLVTALAPGSSSVTCLIASSPNAPTGSTTVTVTAAPNISFPVCPPCTLPAGTNGTAYSQTFRAVKGVGPYTWDCNGSCAGLLPTGLSFSSLGVLSGTPSVNGTTSWPVRVTDTTNGTAVVTVSLTISGTTLGPPTYLGSTNSTANPGLITSYFSSSSAQNATAYDSTLNPTTDCILLATTATTAFNGQSMTGSMSGGANGHDWAWDETMVALSDQGGGVSIFGVTTNSSGCPQITNPGVPAWHSLPSPTAFDWFTAAGKANHDIYMLKSKHIIQKATVSNLNSMGTITTLFDYAAAGSCPGPIPSPIVSGTIFAPVAGSGSGLRFTVGISSGNQGTGTEVFSYDQTLGCTTLDLKNGVYYPWCLASCSSESAVPLSTSGNYCYGFAAGQGYHDLQPSGDGTVARISVDFPMTTGVCAGINLSSQTVAWTIGTGTTTYTNGELTGGASCPNGIQCQYDGHPSEGISKALGSGAGLGFNIRNVSNYAGAYTFAAPQLQSFSVAPYTDVPVDNHGAWVPANTPDAFPMWLGATDRFVKTDVSPCAPTSEVYCPPYLGQVLFALPIDGSSNRPRLFVHTHSCGQSGTSDSQCSDGPDSYFNNYDAITSASPQGNYMSFSSTDLHSFGLDGAGKFRSNILIVRLQ